MKSTAVDESLSSMNQQFCSREINYVKCYNRMRNLHKCIFNVSISLSSMNQQFCSRENQLRQMLQQNEKSTQMHI